MTAMITQGDLKRKFSMMIAQLIVFINAEGYEVKLDDGQCKPCPECGWFGHNKKGFHPKGLAQDLNIYLNKIYLTETSDYEFAGEFWELLGGTWGGRWDDGGHFSLGE